MLRGRLCIAGLARVQPSVAVRIRALEVCPAPYLLTHIFVFRVPRSSGL